MPMDFELGYASNYVVFRVDKSRAASRINRCSESIAGIKMISSEAKLIKRISEINEYLDKSILDIKSAVKLLEDNHTPDWKELNQLFLREINRDMA